MLSKFKRSKHQQHLAQLPKLPQTVADVRTLYTPSDYRATLLELIANATQRIYLVALYLEHDDAGRDILNALYQAKQRCPALEICILVDWHRAQRGRIGAAAPIPTPIGIAQWQTSTQSFPCQSTACR